jgi:cob(I)alamin adenosyltransferase
MALYTGKGDDGATKTFGAKGRISKASSAAEALGALDELNSFLGLAKHRARSPRLRVGARGAFLDDLAHEMQKNLFIAQAEIAGADKRLTRGKVARLERLVGAIERELPPIKSFFIPGASELGAVFDVARAVARRAERRVVAAHEAGTPRVGAATLAYLNRLSSALYAMARLANHRSGIREEAPDYR